MENKKFQKIKKWNSEVIIFPERGGHIVSIVIDWVEILYQDMYNETLFDLSKSIRWWIPYMFPNAWKLTEEQNQKLWTNLPQHWIWRISKWEILKIKENWKISQKFEFKWDDRFPYIWEIINNIEIINSWVKITHEIINTWEKTFPISTWLHPYFRVPEWKKDEIKWKFDWWEEVKKQIDSWANDKPISFDNPWTPLKVFISGLWELTIEVSTDYKKFWVRSIPWKDFVCIEPVMNDVWWIVDKPVEIKQWEKNINYMKISLNN